jgi:hypothetical protein
MARVPAYGQQRWEQGLQAFYCMVMRHKDRGSGTQLTKLYTEVDSALGDVRCWGQCSAAAVYLYIYFSRYMVKKKSRPFIGMVKFKPDDTEAKIETASGDIPSVG